MNDIQIVKTPTENGLKVWVDENVHQRCSDVGLKPWRYLSFQQSERETNSIKPMVFNRSVSLLCYYFMLKVLDTPYLKVNGEFFLL